MFATGRSGSRDGDGLQVADMHDEYGSIQCVEIPCPLCNAWECHFERTVEGFRLVRCETCELVFVNPQPDPAGLARIYRDKKDPQRLIDIYARLATPSVRAEYDRKLDQLEAVLGRKGKILDFACAAAYFVERASLRGWEGHGVDIGPWVKVAAERRSVSNIHVGELSELNFPDGCFDVIYAAQVLEHLQQPLRDMAELKRILSGDGVLYIDVPNYHTLPIMIGKDDFYLNSPPQHINFFTPRTLRRLLNTAGFEVIFMTTEGGLKWESLFGRQIISDIADAYRTNTGPQEPAPAPAQSRLKGILRPIADAILYRRFQLGMNLVAIARPS